MRKSFFKPNLQTQKKAGLAALTGVSLIFLLAIFAGCVSAPVEPTAPPDVWTLLRQGDPGARDLFLSEVEVNATDPDGRTPLHIAAERNDAALVSFFLSLGANPNVRDNFNRSPLGIAVERNNDNITRLLVNSNADIHLPISDVIDVVNISDAIDDEVDNINIVHEQNTTAARMAMARSNSVIAALATPRTVEAVDAEGKTILHLTSEAGNVAAVNNILNILNAANGAINTINKRDNSGRNALDYALARGDSRNHMEVAENLILSGANSENPIYSFFAPAVLTGNYNIRRSDGLAPIHFAVNGNHRGLIDFLLEKNINVNIQSSSGSTPLHEAARSGNIELMRLLLDRGADVNATDAKGNTVLHMGIPVQVHREAVMLFLERGANPNMRDEHGETPLHILVMLNRSADLAQILLGGGADVHIRNIQGQTPLFIAVQENRRELIPVLISYGAEVFAADNAGMTPFNIALRDDGGLFDLLVIQETVNQRDGMGNTMLHAAVRNRGLPRHIGIILDNRVLVDASNRDGDTALHIAVRLNQRENGEFLISRGANIFALNSAGESPLFIALTAPTGIRYWLINPDTIIATDGLGNNMLHFASQWNLDNAIPVIVQRGVSVESQNATGQTPLFHATRTNSTSTMRVLLDNNANIAATDNQGNTLLHTAVRWNAVNAAGLLISSGVDINAHTLSGDTALHYSVVMGMSEVETMLIAQGAYLEVRDVGGNTPFMLAVRDVNLSSLTRLAANGADVNTRNVRGDTPLHIAVAMENYDMVQRLLPMRVSIHARNTRNRTPFQNAFAVSPQMVSTLLTSDRVNASDDMGNSALHIALQERASTETIRAIVDRGARVNAVDNRGQTPLRVAMDLDLLEAARIIVYAGADPFFRAVDNRSPADIAFARGDTHIRALFSGRSINATDTSMNTVLHYAARFGTPANIETLLELGANRTLRNLSAETPADIAVRWNRPENANLLR